MAENIPLEINLHQQSAYITIKYENDRAIIKKKVIRYIKFIPEIKINTAHEKRINKV